MICIACNLFRLALLTNILIGCFMVSLAADEEGGVLVLGESFGQKRCKMDAERNLGVLILICTLSLCISSYINYHRCDVSKIACSFRCLLRPEQIHD
jgi:hypothetical protein